MPVEPGEVRWSALFSAPFYHPTVLVDRELLDRHALRYDTSFEESEDHDLWLRLLEHSGGDERARPARPVPGAPRAGLPAPSRAAARVSAARGTGGDPEARSGAVRGRGRARVACRRRRAGSRGGRGSRRRGLSRAARRVREALGPRREGAGRARPRAAGRAGFGDGAGSNRRASSPSGAGPARERRRAAPGAAPAGARPERGRGLAGAPRGRRGRTCRARGGGLPRADALSDTTARPHSRVARDRPHRPLRRTHRRPTHLAHRAHAPSGLPAGAEASRRRATGPT